MKRTYIAPSVEEVVVDIEKGFATSPDIFGDYGEPGTFTEGDVYEW